MAIRKLRYEGDPVLGKVCKEVKEMTPHLQELVQDMLETMYAAEGVGLAAPQVLYMVHDLKEKGLDIDSDITTVAEAKEAILALWDKKRKRQV